MFDFGCCLSVFFHGYICIPAHRTPLAPGTINLFAGGLVDNRCVPWLAQRSWHGARAEAGGFPGAEGTDDPAAAPGRQRFVRVRAAVAGSGNKEGNGNW